MVLELLAMAPMDVDAEWANRRVGPGGPPCCEALAQCSGALETRMELMVLGHALLSCRRRVVVSCRETVQESLVAACIFVREHSEHQPLVLQNRCCLCIELMIWVVVLTKTDA